MGYFSDYNQKGVSMRHRSTAVSILLAASAFSPAFAAALPGPLAALPVPALPVPALPAPAAPAAPENGGLPSLATGVQGVLEVQPIVLSETTVALPGLEGTQTLLAQAQLDRKLTVTYRVGVNPSVLAPNAIGGVTVGTPADVEVGVGGVLPQ